MAVYVTSAFDGGNVVVHDASRPDDVRLAIAPDAGSDHYQWFCFLVAGVRDQELRLVIENAGGASYPAGWEGYRACASYDREHWFRVPTRYENEALVIEHRPAHDGVYFAYFAPYSLERHRDLVARAARRPRTRYEVLGETLDGRPLDLLQIGAADDAKARCWIIARQHPGETMAEWLVEGVLERLGDPDDPVARVLLDRTVLYVVPNMNPDGSFRGHLRTNAAGTNLNRVWNEPTADHSPEVLAVWERMRRTGVDFFLDVHGDEALPYNFIAGADGVAHLGDRARAGRTAYEAALTAASPDFQTAHGYPKASPGNADLRKATNQIASHFDAVAMTLEQPFKDNANLPDEVHGWSPARCRLLGRANLDALHAIADHLRG